MSSMAYPRFITGSAEKAAHLEWLKTQRYSDLLQKDRILKYITEYGSVTPLEAFRDLGIMRLGARVFELIEEGCLAATIVAAGRGTPVLGATPAGTVMVPAALACMLPVHQIHLLGYYLDIQLVLSQAFSTEGGAKQP